MSRFLPLSFDLATRLTLPVGTREKRHFSISAGSVRLLLAVLARGAAAVDDWERYEDHERQERIEEHHTTGDVHYDKLYVCPGQLRADLRLKPNALRGDIVRIRSMRPRLIGPDPGPCRTPLSGGMRHRQGQSARGTEQVVWLQVERTLLAMSGGRDAGESEGSVVWMDMARMHDFSCRYSPLAYVRMLAWMQAPVRMPQDWKARTTGKGAVAADIPIAQVREALGFDGHPRAADVERWVLAPVARDLRWAGVDFTFKWIRNGRGEPVALRIRVEAVEALRTEALATAARERVEARAARNARPRKVKRKPRPAGPPRPQPHIETPEELQAPGLRGLEARRRAREREARLAWGAAQREARAARRRDPAQG